MEKKFRKDFSSLESIDEFVRSFAAGHALDENMVFTLNFVIEEIFTNMVKYNKESREDVEISLSKEGKKLIIRLTDFDVEPFDVTKRGEVNVNRPLTERKAGGLGIHLVKRMVDQIDYDYSDRKSTITLIKMLEE